MLSKCTAENHSIDEINKSIWILQFICLWITLFYLTELIRSLNLFLFLWSLLFFSLVAVYELQLRHCTIEMMIYFVCIGRSSMWEMLVYRLPYSVVSFFRCCHCCYFYCFVHFVCVCVCKRIHKQMRTFDMYKLVCTFEANSAFLFCFTVWVCKIRSVRQIQSWRF